MNSREHWVGIKPFNAKNASTLVKFPDYEPVGTQGFLHFECSISGKQTKTMCHLMIQLQFH